MENKLEDYVLDDEFLDNFPCVNCGAYPSLDTGLECSECGYDNWDAVMTSIKTI